MKFWLKRNYYRLHYYKKKVKFGKKVLVDIHNNFEGCNAIGEKSIVATCNIGLGTYIADNSIIKKALVGRFCSIGSNVQTGLGVHPSRQFVSTHPAFFSTRKQAGFSFVERDIFEEQIFIDNDRKHVVKIGNDVWIGNNVIIADGVIIGDGAIVATGSIVMKDVVPYAIVGGNPAKVIGFRFSEQQIEMLMNTKWWNWSYEKIQSNSSMFTNIKSFAANINL